MEEEDEVVQEIPVFLSQALSDNLYIYQYPVRPGNRDWNDVTVVNASVKPKSQLVRLEIGLDTYSDKYCPSKGEQIALNTDGSQEPHYRKDKEKEKSQYFKSSMMDKIVYESSNPCTDSRNYAIAVLQDKELHITPVKGIVQLRPTHSYYDKQDKHKQEKNKEDVTDDEDKEAEPQQVTVKFARQETEVSKKAREKSYETISQRIASEAWYDALWKSPESDQADLERLKLISSTHAEGAALAVRGRDYVRALVPPPPADEADLALALPPVAQQVQDILVGARLVSFAELRALVRTAEGRVAAPALLQALGNGGCCVRGLWTASSERVYTKDSAAPKQLLCAARDHVLYLFTQHPYIDRRKVAATVRLPPLEVLSIIRSVAKYNSKLGGWELLLPPDVAFENKYPDVVQRQNLYWEARQRQFNEMMIGESVPKRQRKKSQRDSISSDTMMSPKTRCSSFSEEDTDKRRNKNKSMTGTGKRTRNFSSSSQHDGT